MTSTLQLTRYDGEGGIEILINPITGESFCSVKGYARMSGRSASTIRERLYNVTEAFQGGREQPVKTAEIPTNGGLQGGRLITEEQIVEWIPKDNPAAATLLLKIGVRMALHKMAGYEIKSTAMPETQPIVSLLDAQVQRALALAGGGGALAIEAFKLIHGIPNTPTAAAPASPEPKPTKPTKAKATKATPTPLTEWDKAAQEAEARELVKSFMRDVETLVSAGILGLWDVADVKQNFKPCTAIVLQSVIPLLEAHFSCQIDRARLEAAIVTIGGKSGQNQRFLPESPADRNKGHRSIVRKCSVIPCATV